MVDPLPRGKDPDQIAQGIRAALDVTGTPPPAGSPAPGTIDLDTAGIDTAMGTKGTNDGGIYKFTFARNETVSMDGKVLPPAVGVTTVVNFQPTGGGKAAINGDFAMTAGEAQRVTKVLRSGGIEIVEIHNHSLNEDPRLLYMHFWANDDATELAETLGQAIGQHNVKPAG